ncbi:MAG: malate dehydrogenase [Candidatus Xenolissoclinum pacificiensis L6]|uniref:Malate dehydrogenase n=1 Tax=Candidatus Xenolissoclinum pacificiensis L6 TaxID=1401685 RepID=W2V2E3_9RICK|nr:MAG: malate dehydrogenase [Candidatus Xenolissoclinum pacificiensis L6]
MKRKITVIGAGNIGGLLSNLLCIKEIADVLTILDVNGKYAEGVSLDISQANSVSCSDTKIIGTDSFEHIRDSQVIVITAGVARKPNMTREELLKINVEVISSISKNIKKYTENQQELPLIITVTNPLDIMSWVVKNITNFPKHKVIGMSGILDTARLCYFLSQKVGCAISDVHSMVLGGHGDQMVPLISNTSIAGISIDHFVKTGTITDEQIRDIIEKTQKGGGQIVSLLEKGSAFNAPAMSVLKMIECYLSDNGKFIPCSTYLEGEYGFNGLYMGVPVILSPNKEKFKILELKLSNDESIMLKNSAKIVEDNISLVKQYLRD